MLPYKLLEYCGAKLYGFLGLKTTLSNGNIHFWTLDQSSPEKYHIYSNLRHTLFFSSKIRIIFKSQAHKKI